MMQIRAAIARDPCGLFTMERVELELPRDDEVLVRIAGVGLCHTDLVARDQVIPSPLPAIFGHEGAGIVEQVGRNVRKVAPGDAVVLTFLSCGHCARCIAGDPAYCIALPVLNFSGKRTDGSSALSIGGQRIGGHFFGQSSFASHALAKERNVVKISADVPVEIMGPLGCGIQTGAGAVMRSMQCQPGSSLAILGGGSVGLAAVLAAVLVQCARIVVVDRLEARRELAMSLGATDFVTSVEVANLPAQLGALVPGGFDYVFDTTGISEVIEAGLTALRNRGVAGLVGAPPVAGTTFSIRTGLFVQRGIVLKGIMEGDSDPDSFIPELVEFYREGRFPFDRLITRYPLEQINTAIADQHSGRCVKAVLIP